jgi:hypothetical protein
MITGHDVDVLRALKKIGTELEKANKLKEQELKLKQFQEAARKEREANKRMF